MQADINFLQTFVREHKVPVLQFDLDNTKPIEPMDTKRFETLITGLNSKGTVSPIYGRDAERRMALMSFRWGLSILAETTGV
jgi:hypothetical protein